jgi:hypothetical protein
MIIVSLQNPVLFVAALPNLIINGQYGVPTMCISPQHQISLILSEIGSPPPMVRGIGGGGGGIVSQIGQPSSVYNRKSRLQCVARGVRDCHPDDIGEGDCRRRRRDCQSDNQSSVNCLQSTVENLLIAAGC